MKKIILPLVALGTAFCTVTGVAQSLNFFNATSKPILVFINNKQSIKSPMAVDSAAYISPYLFKNIKIDSDSPYSVSACWSTSILGTADPTCLQSFITTTCPRNINSPSIVKATGIPFLSNGPTLTCADSNLTQK